MPEKKPPSVPIHKRWENMIENAGTADFFCHAELGRESLAEFARLESALKEAQERHTRLRIAARAVVMAPRLAHRELGNAIDELSEVIENDQPDPTPSPSQSADPQPAKERQP